MEDLNWLAEAKPEPAEILKSARGRQPNTNPLEGHLSLSHSAGKAQALPMSAKDAPDAERLIRRAATRHGWSVTVQVLSKSPGTASTDDVIPLKDLKPTRVKATGETVAPKVTPGTDVWVVFLATDKPAEDAPATVSAQASDAPAAPAPVTDPFQAPAATASATSGKSGKVAVVNP
jgi:hypothetical protein